MNAKRIEISTIAPNSVYVAQVVFRSINIAILGDDLGHNRCQT
jgi:hypothetical protein